MDTEDILIVAGVSITEVILETEEAGLETEEILGTEVVLYNVEIIVLVTEVVLKIVVDLEVVLEVVSEVASEVVFRIGVVSEDVVGLPVGLPEEAVSMEEEAVLMGEEAEVDSTEAV